MVKLNDVYEKSYSFLLSEAEKLYISKEQIDAYITTSDYTGPKDIRSAYILFLKNMQDFYRYPNIIRFDERKQQIIDLLHNCDLEYISSLSPEKFADSFSRIFSVEKGEIIKKYSQSIISGALFMSDFRNDKSFVEMLDYFDESIMTREALALYLSKKIYNMGFALACNWLKEFGYMKYAKPDKHTKDVCKKLKLIETDDDIECFEAIIRIADEAGVEPYTVDKVLWLICSGDFYRYDKKFENPQITKAKFFLKLEEFCNR